LSGGRLEAVGLPEPGHSDLQGVRAASAGWRGLVQH
jgi:hypothetical protein